MGNKIPTPLLEDKEWILLQIKEGPRSQGCKYCYERPFLINKLAKFNNYAEHDRKDDHQRIISSG